MDLSQIAQWLTHLPPHMDAKLHVFRNGQVQLDFPNSPSVPPTLSQADLETLMAKGPLSEEDMNHLYSGYHPVTEAGQAPLHTGYLPWYPDVDDEGYEEHTRNQRLAALVAAEDPYPCDGCGGLKSTEEHNIEGHTQWLCEDCTPEANKV